jgi:hypothetical protein
MLRSSVRQGLLFISVLAILSTGSAVSQSFAQSTTDPGQSQKPVLEQSDLYPDEGVDGVGYLTISHLYLDKVAGLNLSHHEASKTVKIVFFDRPQGQEIAKIERGILSKGDKVISQDFAAPLLTYYAQPSFTVLEKRSGGWYRIRYMVGQGSAGIGWVQVKKQDPFVYRSWQEYFLSADVILAEFRNEKGNNLFDRPSSSGKRLKDITGSIEIQEFRGDWMKVKFREKVFHCDAEPTPKNVSVRSGWVKWRDRGQLLISAPAKGC